MKSSDDITGQTFDVFQARRKISSGSFGTVYFGINTQTNEQVAIKVEKIVDEDLRSVLKEAKFLKSLEGIKGIPMVLYSGSKADLDIMVLSLLAKDLVTYMKIYKRFSLKTGLMIFEQGLSILENIHSRNIVHRDIKPENILMGREKDAETVYFVDFGISKFYKDNFGRHIPFMENKVIIFFFLNFPHYFSFGNTILFLAPNFPLSFSSFLYAPLLSILISCSFSSSTIPIFIMTFFTLLYSLH